MLDHKLQVYTKEDIQRILHPKSRNLEQDLEQDKHKGDLKVDPQTDADQYQEEDLNLNHHLNRQGYHRTFVKDLDQEFLKSSTSILHSQVTFSTILSFWKPHQIFTQLFQ